jgi:hypothetical protein
MTSTMRFFRSDLFLSLVGGFALGVAGMNMVKPATASGERAESKAVQIEAPAHADQSKDPRFQ